MKQTMALVADWYKKYQTTNVYDLTVEEINHFVNV